MEKVSLIAGKDKTKPVAPNGDRVLTSMRGNPPHATLGAYTMDHAYNHFQTIPCPFPTDYKFRQIMPMLRTGEKSAAKRGERVNLGNNYEFPLSNLRITITTRNGGMHRFQLYTYAPFFERADIVRHYASECGRVRVFPVRFTTGERSAETNKLLSFTMPDQFEVYVNGKRVPDHQYTIARAAKPKQHRERNAGKQSLGKVAANTFSHPIHDPRGML